MKKTKKIINVSDEHCFWSCDGSIARNLEDLKNVLLKMDKKCFIYHVNKEKNDFANWVKEVLGDDSLSNKLRKIKTIKTTVKVIDDSLKK